MSEPFRASCSACGVKFLVKDPSLIGKRVRCPKCKQPTLIEAPPTGSAPSPPDSRADDPLGLGDLSSFGVTPSGAAPFPTQSLPVDPLFADPLPANPLTSDPLGTDPFAPNPGTLPSNPFPGAPFPHAPQPNSPFASTGRPPAGLPNAGMPMTPQAPSFGMGSAASASGGRATAPVADPSSNKEGLLSGLWNSVSARTKIRIAIMLVPLVLAILGGFVALIGRTAGLGYVGNYAARPERSLRDMRASFKTDIRGEGPAPQQPTTKVDLPNLWSYPSSDGQSLQASLRLPSGDGPFPAVVFCHGGFSLSTEDIDATDVFLRAGFAVYAPSWRGENGNPGHYELCLGEAADCAAAMEYLARRGDIDPDGIFLVGHSLGAINAMLAAEISTRPRGAVAIGGMLDMYGLHRWQMKRFIDEIPYDTSNDKEELLRSPARFLADLSCPARLVYGSKEFVPALEQGKAIAAASSQLGKKVEFIELKGMDHFTSLKPALNDSVQYFQQLMKEPRQSPAPTFEDRTPEWLAQQLAQMAVVGVSERHLVAPLLNEPWQVQLHPTPPTDFAPLYQLAEEYGAGIPFIAGPKQWWSVSVGDNEFRVFDLVNRTLHRVQGRRTLVDDKSWGGASGFVELSPDGKTLLWHVETGGDANTVPKQQIVVQQAQDLVALRTIEKAVGGQYISPTVAIISRPTFTGKPIEYYDNKKMLRLPYALRRVDLTTGEESPEINVRAGGIWSISPNKTLLAISHPTDAEVMTFANTKEVFDGQTLSMEMMIVDLQAWKVVARGQYRNIPSGRAMAWSSDGIAVATVSTRGEVGWWEIATGQAARLTGVGNVAASRAPNVRFLNSNRMLLVNDAHLLQIHDGRKVVELQPAPGVKIETTSWVGDRYRSGYVGAYVPFPFQQIRDQLQMASESSSNLLTSGKVDLTVEPYTGEQVAPEVLAFVREHMPKIVLRRFNWTVDEADKGPHLKLKILYGEKMDLLRAEKSANGRASHSFAPLDLGGKQQCRLTIELSTPDDRIVLKDSVTAEVALPKVDMSVPTGVQLRIKGIIEAFNNLQAKVPLTVPRDPALEPWPRKIALSASPPSKLAWNLPETTATVGKGATGKAAAVASPETANLPSRLAIQAKDRSQTKSSRYALGIVRAGERPMIIAHGISGDTQWIPLDEKEGDPPTMSLDPGMPAFSPDGVSIANRAGVKLIMQTIGDGGTLSEAKSLTFPTSISSLAWSRTGKLLALARAPNVVEVYEAQALRAASAAPDVSPVAKLTTTGPSYEMNFSVDEQRIVVVDSQQVLVAFDVTSGMQLGRFTLPVAAPPAGTPPVRGRGGAPAVLGAAFSADGKHVYGLNSGGLIAFDMTSGKQSGNWPAPNATALIPSPDGNWVAILQSTLGGQLRRTDNPENWRSLTLETTNRVITTNADMKGGWSPDSQIFAATDQRGTITAWDVAP